ncbi:MAG TPA: hypothetical protein PLH94_11385 [Fimbriimonadaceae bacterium]|nr:hypothetical protein [Fimbriimonadaceae bacterium]
MREYLDAVLIGAVFLSALMVLVWLLRLKTQGARAYVMASAFAVLGFLALAFRSEQSPALIYGLGGLLGILLVADVIIKIGRQARKESGRG